MNKTFKKVLCAVLVVCMVLSVALTLTSCNNKKDTSVTYKSYTTALGNNWNPHSWETNADDSILSYLSSPFITMEAKDTENGVYQWVYEMATSIKDVTKDNQADLTKYSVSLPEGTEATEVESGYVFEIKLNPDATWENGVKINADDYIYSMQQLINPKMRNYRANLYIAGESALAGAAAYYDSGAPIYAPAITYDAEDNRVVVADPAEKDMFIDLDGTLVNLNPDYTFYDLMDMGYIDSAIYDKIADAENAYGFAKVTADNKADVIDLVAQYLSAFNVNIYVYEYEKDAEGNVVTDEKGNPVYAKDDDGNLIHVLDANGNKAIVDGAMEYVEDCYFYFTDKYGAEVSYDKVGCYKVDEYTIRYVCQTAIDFNYFLTSCTSTWLVYKDLYEAGKDTTGELITTNYGTSKETSMSYGVYKMASFQEEKQIVFVQNENWYGWQKDEDGKAKKDEDGNLISYTSYHKNLDGEAFYVDGEDHRQHLITKYVIDVMDEATAKNAFLKGDLSDWAPLADELPTYAASDRLVKVDETYTMSFFFNTNVEDLKAMDASKGNQNSVVLSNINFRKAFSFAIDRAKYVTATEGYKPAFSLMNSLYHYDFYNNPESSYRNTEQAMQAIVNLYGVKYGEGTPYATLKEAHDSITGYNLTEAKNLMKTACDELVAAGLYKAGEEIKIKIGWAKGALTSADNQQAVLMNQFINDAIVGSGFGKVTFEPIGNIEDRYGDVAKGEYAIGYGAWGGAALYPFRNFQVYFDPSQYDINEGACWDPTKEELTLTIGGEEVTMTWQAWGNSMIGTGKYAQADFETQLTITSMLETKFLEKYYRIPLAGTTICSMMSDQFDYYTNNYNLAYGFGGSRLMKVNYNNSEWAKYVKSQGGELDYE